MMANQRQGIALKALERMDSIKKNGSDGTFKWSTACWLQGVQWNLHIWCVVKENQEARLSWCSYVLGHLHRISNRICCLFYMIEHARKRAV